MSGRTNVLDPLDVWPRLVNWKIRLIFVLLSLLRVYAVHTNIECPKPKNCIVFISIHTTEIFCWPQMGLFEGIIFSKTYDIWPHLQEINVFNSKFWLLTQISNPCFLQRRCVCMAKQPPSKKSRSGLYPLKNTLPPQKRGNPLWIFLIPSLI